MLFADLTWPGGWSWPTPPNTSPTPRRGRGCSARAVARGSGSAAAMPFSQGRTTRTVASVGLGLDGPVGEAAFEQCEAFYRRHDIQPAFSLCPLADPTLLEHLNRRGYQIEMFMHVWYRPLAAMRPFRRRRPASSSAPSSRRKRICGRSSRSGAGWTAMRRSRTTMSSSHPTRSWRTRVVGWRGTTASRPARPRWQSTTAWRACSARARVCRIATSGCSTRSLQPGWPRPRKRCDLAVVHTEPGSDSQRNVERLGFRLAYTKVTMRSENA